MNPGKFTSSARCRCVKAMLTSNMHTKATLEPPLESHVISQMIHTEYTDDAEVTRAENESDACAVKPFSAMPGPRGLPLIGNALKYTKFGPYSFEKILDNRLTYMRKYGKIYRERLGTMDFVHLFDPKDIAIMFRKEGKYPSRGKIANLEVTYLKRNNKLIGFAFLDGPEWARQRNIIQKLMMHPSSSSRYLTWQAPVAEDFADYIGQKRGTDGILTTLYEDLFKYTMESVGSVAFGERLGALDDVSQSGDSQSEAGVLSSAIAVTFLCFRKAMFSIPWYAYFRTPTYRKFENAANIMRSIMTSYVDKVQARVQSRGRPYSGKTTCPFTSGLLDQSQSMFEILLSDDRVSHELAVNLVMALLRTGIDSTANALAFFLYNLATNGDKQQNVVDEIRAVIPEGSTIKAEHLQKMSYLKAALRESFRLHYPVFGGSGRVMPEDTVFSGYKVPKGVFIFANMAAMSRMEEYFPKPEEYHPERWLRDDRSRMCTTCTEDSGFLSLGFSHGLRACPGRRFAEQGLYLAVIAILRKYKLEYEGPAIGMINMPFTTPDRPLNIKFTPRN